MTRRALMVCTANVCRSPVAAALLACRLTEGGGVHDQEWVVTSAGLADVRAGMDPNTLDAAWDVGIDLRGHRRRLLDRETLATDGADLVLTMTRAHVRGVIGIDPSAWPRTFTLKELSRRVTTIGPPARTERLSDWMARAAGGRRAAAMMNPDPSDDVADPFGGPRSQHRAMVAEVAQHVDTLVRWGPWAA